MHLPFHVRIALAAAALARAVHQHTCRHEFDLYQAVKIEDGLVEWPCCKCKRAFRATHGLAILSGHGKLRPTAK